MAVQTAVSVIIGAELGGTFKGAFGSVQKQLSTLGSSIKKLDVTAKQISSFKTLRKDTVATYTEWRTAEKEVARLAQEISKTDKPSKELQNNFRRSQKEASLAKQAFMQNKNALTVMGDALRKAGLDTKNLAVEQNRLGKALETLKTHQSALAKASAARSANVAKRSEYRTQMVDALALGATLYGMVKPAIAFESAMADVKKVVDFKNPKEVKQMEQDIKNLAKTIPLSLDGLAAIVAAGGQLGIPREHLAGFAETASKMSVAMDISADIAGQSMAKLSNVLQVPINQIGKVGDVVNHLSNNIAATGAEIIEVNLRAGSMGRSFGLAHNEISALAGTFVELGKSPEISGTAINMLTSRLKLLPVSTGEARKSFNKLGLSMKEYTKLIEGGKGQEAIFMVLEALKKVQGVKRSKIMQDLFGEQANRHINSLVEGLDKYKSNLKLVGDESAYAGSMQKEFAARSATTENNIQLLRNNLAILATNIGSVLLPVVNSVVGVFTKATATMADFSDKHPTLTKYIGMAVAGLLAFKVATIGLGYGFTFVKAPFLFAVQAFAKFRTVIALARLGLFAVIPAIKAIGVALMSNPIGLIIGGIALLAGVLIANWDKVAPYFEWVTEKIRTAFTAVGEVVGNVWKKITGFFTGIKTWLSNSIVGKAWNWTFSSDEKLGANDNNPPQIGASLGESGFSTPATSNVIELPRSQVSTGSQNSVSISAPITINASPGMSEAEVANQVARQLKEREIEAQRRQRAVNYD